MRINRKNERERPKPSSPSFAKAETVVVHLQSMRTGTLCRLFAFNVPRNLIGRNYHQDSGGADLCCIPRDRAAATISQEFQISNKALDPM